MEIVVHVPTVVPNGHIRVPLNGFIDRQVTSVVLLSFSLLLLPCLGLALVEPALPLEASVPIRGKSAAQSATISVAELDGFHVVESNQHPRVS